MKAIAVLFIGGLLCGISPLRSQSQTGSPKPQTKNLARRRRHYPQQLDSGTRNLARPGELPRAKPVRFYLSRYLVDLPIQPQPPHAYYADSPRNPSRRVLAVLRGSIGDVELLASALIHARRGGQLPPQRPVAIRTTGRRTFRLPPRPHPSKFRAAVCRRTRRRSLCRRQPHCRLPNHQALASPTRGQPPHCGTRPLLRLEPSSGSSTR
jgi:hypothetical protein